MLNLLRLRLRLNTFEYCEFLNKTIKRELKQSCTHHIKPIQIAYA